MQSQAATAPLCICSSVHMIITYMLPRTPTNKSVWTNNPRLQTCHSSSTLSRSMTSSSQPATADAPVELDADEPGRASDCAADDGLGAVSSSTAERVNVKRGWAPATAAAAATPPLPLAPLTRRPAMSAAATCRLKAAASISEIRGFASDALSESTRADDKSGRRCGAAAAANTE